MLLSDTHLKWYMTDKSLKIEPFNPKDLQPASIDVHLADGLEVFSSPVHGALPPYRMINPLNLPERFTYPTGGVFALQPGEFVLGSTLEKVTLGHALAARVEGKSSLGRLGLAIHVTAGFIDPGFSGNITLELHNVAPYAILLTPGMPIGQLCVFRVSSEVERPYGSPELRSRYQGQSGTTPSHGVDQPKQ